MTSSTLCDQLCMIYEAIENQAEQDSGELKICVNSELKKIKRKNLKKAPKGFVEFRDKNKQMHKVKYFVLEGPPNSKTPALIKDMGRRVLDITPLDVSEQDLQKIQAKLSKKIN